MDDSTMAATPSAAAPSEGKPASSSYKQKHKKGQRAIARLGKPDTLTSSGQNSMESKLWLCLRNKHSVGF
ncbi:MAG: hypothetical protein ACRDAX_07770 [Propionibacteriaceae bacterium]